MNFFKKNKYWLIIATVMVIVVAIDLITKSLFDNQEVTLIEGVISISPTLNPGGAWGILSENTNLLTLFSIIVLIALFWINISIKQKTTFFSIGMGLIIGGAVGNLIDRVVLHHVRDFIRLDFMNFPIFNFADICLSVGAVMMIIYFLFLFKNEALEKNKK